MYSNKHNTSQKHKIKREKYQIDPNSIPRPNAFNEIYSNESKEPIYFSFINSIPPFSSTFFKVIESENSSCRFIRSSMTKVPLSQSILQQTHLVFGIYFQPFTNIPQYDDEIKKIDLSENYNIIRCKNCRSYINNKYTFGSKNFKCNICNSLNDVFVDESNIINRPSVDYLIKKTDFKPYYLFMIDETELSFSNGLISYILNSLNINLDNFHNIDNSYFGIATYNEKEINFYYSDKNEVKLVKVTDINDTFCPIDSKKLFCNIGENKEKILNLIEKININISNKFENIKKKSTKKNNFLLLNIIQSGIDSLIEHGGRLLIFHNYNNDLNLNEEALKEKSDSLIDKCNNNRITIDQFIYDIFSKGKYDDINFKLFSKFSSETGGHFNYYPLFNVEADNLFSNIEIVSTLEKIHYDINSIISVNNYYETKFMLRHSKEIDCFEIIGSFLNKNQEAIEFGGCSNDISFGYIFRLIDNLISNQRIHFQIACLFIDNYGYQYLRLFNYTITAEEDINKIYSTIDIDAITKLTLMREVRKSIINPIDDPDKRKKEYTELYKRIVESFIFYRKKGSDDKDMSRLILPSTLKYFPIYINSFIKNKDTFYNYQILSLPIYSVIKMLYPKLYRLDDIQNDQTYFTTNVKDKTLIRHNIGYLNEKLNIIEKPYMLRLSKDSIDFDSAFLIDDGIYINIYIFEKIEFDFYKIIFNCQDWDDCIKNYITTIEDDGENNHDSNNDLKQRILNIISELRNENYGKIQPVRLYFLNERTWKVNKHIILKYLIEDNYNQYSNYVDFLCEVHRDIQKKIDY